MSFRTVTASLLLMTSVASAEEITLAPTCAEIDVDRDTLAPADRATAHARLVHVLQDADVLVVDAGCTEHYVLSHEREGDDTIVRLLGPAGAHEVRNPAADDLPQTYARLVSQLIGDRVAAEPAETIESNESASSEPDYQADSVETVSESAAAVQTDTVLYGTFAMGSLGPGLGFGLRFAPSTATALDFSFQHGSRDDYSQTIISGRVLRYMRPASASSSYIGGGLAHVVERSSSYMEVSGTGVVGTVGYMLNRTGGLRAFVQGDLTLPFEGATPSLMISFGAGG